MSQVVKAPITKPRAIVREYLQALIISAIYREVLASELIFTGGTALRLIRGLDRFSEDLDFDNTGLTDGEMDRLLVSIVKRLEYENIEVELRTIHKNEKNYYDLRFPQMLADLAISTNPKEKLKIKIDYARQWRGQTPESVLFSAYGCLERVKVNPLSQALVEKLAAYVNRQITQPRDVYDVVWLFSQGARVDRRFMSENKLDDLVTMAQQKWEIEGISSTLKQRLQPFLFDPQHLGRLDLFGEVLMKL